MPTTTNKDQTVYWLALKSIKGIGNVKAYKLIDHFITPQAIFEASSTQLAKAGLKPEIIQQFTGFNLATLDPVLEWAAKPERNIISIDNCLYPELLRQTHAKPLVLFTLGNPELLANAQVAVVGTRKPTRQGQENTYELCSALVEQGLTITSGLAAGIDGTAHRAALEMQGYTIAVTGTGLNRVYPSWHRELAHQIALNGLLVSEKFPDTLVEPGCFPQRNRIIAGLSLGTLVIEATSNSGSLITAKYAMDEGREVYAVPSSIHNPQAKGCHHLIKQGAKLVETITDIVEDLPALDHCTMDLSQSPQKPPLSDEDKLFLQHIDHEITPIDLIVTRSQLTVEAVTNKLLLLELEGWVINSTGGYIRQ